ncbi:MAG: UDP-3-O-(3-hydroxymyristoyl)glucosamine N-acyltransferase [Desulfobacterales bacterium]|nr:UDP-3-O-(3-hydroxymyristoyl)glucosamine N-acyltransferase [Desulfobacterales bacterium]
MEFSLAELSEMVGGKVKGDEKKKITGPAPFEEANENQITLAGTPAFIKKINETKAGAIIVPESVIFDPNLRLLAVKNPQAAFAKILKIFTQKDEASKGISHNAHIGKNFTCGKNITISPFVFIGNNVILGNNVYIHPGAVIEDNVTIGDDVTIFSNVSILYGCKIGNRVLINAGSVIGSDGFGFAPEKEAYIKISHSGIVQIDEDVEIGACNTIDRATFGKTWIQKGVKTDNLVHVAHNVTVGENTLLIAQVGIAGSATIGKHAILAGQSGISGHLTIGDNATIGPQSGIAKNVAPGDIVSGTPAIPHKLWLKVQNLVTKLPDFKAKLNETEKKILEIEKKIMDLIINKTI